MLRLYLFATLIGIGMIGTAQRLDIKIINLRNSMSGTILLALFVDEESFANEKEFIMYKYKKSQIKNGELHVQIDVEPGIYGVSVLDDENNSGKMEYRLITLPREGFGFSNPKLRCTKKPKFKDFSFQIDKNETKEIIIPMRYFL